MVHFLIKQIPLQMLFQLPKQYFHGHPVTALHPKSCFFHWFGNLLSTSDYWKHSTFQKSTASLQPWDFHNWTSHVMSHKRKAGQPVHTQCTTYPFTCLPVQCALWASPRQVVGDWKKISRTSRDVIQLSSHVTGCYINHQHRLKSLMISDFTTRWVEHSPRQMLDSDSVDSLYSNRRINSPVIQFSLQ